LRTNFNVPAVGVPLPLLGGLALGAQKPKLDADIRTSSSLGSPSTQIVHEYYPFILEDGGPLTPMVTGLVDCLAILVVVRRFQAWVRRTLVL
jgi:hypothetical protein